MADVTIQIKGMKELSEMLLTFPEKLRTKILRSALREGAKEIQLEAKALVPVGKPSSENVLKYGGYEGALRDSIRLSGEARGTTIIASIKAGGKTRKKTTNVYYAHLIEFTGASPHMIPKEATGAALLAKRLVINGELVTSVLHHGFSAKPFLRPALRDKARDAVAATAKKMRSRITKAGLAAADDIGVGAWEEEE